MTAARIGLRVYYEDTDLAGIVYHANYLRYFERGRTEALRAAGIDQGRLKAEAGLVFVVVSMEAAWRRPARFDDWLEVETETVSVGGAAIDMAQRVLRGAELCAEATVRCATMTLEGRPARMPEAVRAALTG